MTNNIYESGEDYLETILILDEKTKYVRSVDIAAELGYSKPSVSRAMGILKANGLITVEHDGQIKLTKTGLKRANEVYDRHRLIKKFFEHILGVNPVTAEEDACKVEHVISEETFLRLRSYVEEHIDSDK